jgi:hypothetical protein
LCDYNNNLDSGSGPDAARAPPLRRLRPVLLQLQRPRAHHPLHHLGQYSRLLGTARSGPDGHAEPAPAALAAQLLDDEESRLLLQDFVNDPHNYVGVMPTIAKGIDSFSAISRQDEGQVGMLASWPATDRTSSSACSTKPPVTGWRTGCRSPSSVPCPASPARQMLPCSSSPYRPAKVPRTCRQRSESAAASRAPPAMSTAARPTSGVAAASPSAISSRVESSGAAYELVPSTLMLPCFTP